MNKKNIALTSVTLCLAFALNFVLTTAKSIENDNYIRTYNLYTQRNVLIQSNDAIKSIDKTTDDFQKITNEFTDDIAYSHSDKLFNDTMSHDYLIKKFITSERPETRRSVPNRSFAIRDQYGSLADAYTFGYQGTLWIPDSGTYTSLYRQSDQATIDRRVAEVLDWSGPLGVKGATPILAAHNGRGPFGGFGGLKVGSKIYIDTFYGQFVYQVTGMTNGWTYGGGMVYFNDLNASIWGHGGGNSMMLYTCYPFNASVTDSRYVVFADLIEGTILQ